MVCSAYGQQSCTDKVEQMFACMNRLNSNPDFTTIVEKKMNAAKTCGATDKNIQCWRAMYKCEAESKTSTMSSPAFQTAKRDATQCYSSNPNNPLVGLDGLFMGGMHHGGKGRGMGGKMGGTMGGNMGGGNRGPGNMDGNNMGGGNMAGGNMGGGENHDQKDDSSEEDMSDKIPADCMPSNWKTMLNCTMQALQRDQTVISSAAKLRPQLKQCEDMFTSDCEPGTRPLMQCLKKAEAPVMTTMETNFKSCMRTAGISP
jgi:hypothetical protein